MLQSRAIFLRPRDAHIDDDHGHPTTTTTTTVHLPLKPPESPALLGTNPPPSAPHTMASLARTARTARTAAAAAAVEAVSAPPKFRVREKHGVVIKSGFMDKTVTVTCANKEWNSLLKKVGLPPPSTTPPPET